MSAFKRPSITVLFIIFVIILCVLLVFLIPNGKTPEPQVSVDTTTLAAPPSIPLSEFCLGGCPKGALPQDRIVTHHILILANNPNTKFADWVAYKISAATLGHGCKRTWQSDPDLEPESTLRPSDYSGIRDALASDRGHQAPLASLCGSPYWQEADYLSNITPQKSDLNEGPWEHLENHERGLITHDGVDTVYSITGPLFEREMPLLPRAHLDHKVPSAYWKIITVRKQDTFAAAGFIMDQSMQREDDYCDHAIPLDEMERRTHLEFFPELSAEQRALIKASSQSKDLLNALGCPS